MPQTEFVEYPNLRACEWLHSVLSPALLAQHQAEKTKGEQLATFTQIKKYLQVAIKDRKVKVTYHKSALDKKGIFRSYGNGAQSLPGAIRGLLFPHLTDFDMVNCHLVILRSICLKHDIAHSYLADYCDNRKQHIAAGDCTKVDILRSMNKKSALRDCTPYMCAFDKEMKRIQKALMVIYPEILECAAAKPGQRNLEGTFMSYMCSTVENQILDSLVAHFKCDVSVLMFDGFMADGAIPTCEQLSAHVLEKMGIEMAFTVKPHSTALSVPEDWTPDDPALLYAALKQKHEVDYQLAYIVEQSAYSYKAEGGEINFYSKSDMTNILETIKVKDKSFFSMWCADPAREQFTNAGVYFHDRTCPDYTLNLCTGFAVSRVEYPLVDVQPFVDLIEILSNHEVAATNFLLDWMANLFQFPSSPSVAVVIYSSEEGAGKGILVETLLATMVGVDKFYNITDPETELFGPFNDHLRNTVLANLNETDRASMVHYYDRLKGLINSPMISVHPKGQKAFLITNCRHYICTTNNPDAMKVKEGNRRYFLCEASIEKVGNTDYFDGLGAWFKSPQVRYSIYRYLMARTVPRTFSAADIPITKLALENFKLSRDPVEDFAAQMATTTNLYFSYQEFCRSTGLQHILAQKSFEMKFARIMPKYKITSKRMEHTTDGKRERYREYSRGSFLLG
jgi:hypothetical protein